VKALIRKGPTLLGNVQGSLRKAPMRGSGHQSIVSQKGEVRGNKGVWCAQRRHQTWVERLGPEEHRGTISSPLGDIGFPTRSPSSEKKMRPILATCLKTIRRRLLEGASGIRGSYTQSVIHLRNKVQEGASFIAVRSEVEKKPFHARVIKRHSTQVGNPRCSKKSLQGQVSMRSVLSGMSQQWGGGRHQGQARIKHRLCVYIKSLPLALDSSYECQSCFQKGSRRSRAASGQVLDLRWKIRKYAGKCSNEGTHDRKHGGKNRRGVKRPYHHLEEGGAWGGLRYR